MTHQPPSPRPPLAPWLTPGTFLLMSSLPLGAGAYIGYRRALQEPTEPSFSKSTSSANGGVFRGRGGSVLEQMLHPEPPMSNSSAASPPRQSIRPNTNVIASGVPPPVLAARALAIGSLLSLSATSLLVSGIFFASGCRSLDELMSAWKSWAPKKLYQVETSLGNALGIPAISTMGEERRAAKLEYESAIKGMTEEEELEYVREKYLGEIRWDDKVSNKTNETSK